jgi:hypothetical protein
MRVSLFAGLAVVLASSSALAQVAQPSIPTGFNIAGAGQPISIPPTGVITTAGGAIGTTNPPTGTTGSFVVPGSAGVFAPTAIIQGQFQAGGVLAVPPTTGVVQQPVTAPTSGAVYVPYSYPYAVVVGMQPPPTSYSENAVRGAAPSVADQNDARPSYWSPNWWTNSASLLTVPSDTLSTSTGRYGQ